MLRLVSSRGTGQRGRWLCPGPATHPSAAASARPASTRWAHMNPTHYKWFLLMLSNWTHLSCIFPSASRSFHGCIQMLFIGSWEWETSPSVSTPRFRDPSGVESVRRLTDSEKRRVVRVEEGWGTRFTSPLTCCCCRDTIGRWEPHQDVSQAYKRSGYVMPAVLSVGLLGVPVEQRAAHRGPGDSIRSTQHLPFLPWHPTAPLPPTPGSCAPPSG